MLLTVVYNFCHINFNLFIVVFPRLFVKSTAQAQRSMKEGGGKKKYIDTSTILYVRTKRFVKTNFSVLSVVSFPCLSTGYNEMFIKKRKKNDSFLFVPYMV